MLITLFLFRPAAAMPDKIIHAKFTLDVLGLRDHPTFRARDILEEFSTTIDSASDLQGRSFFDAVTARAMQDGKLDVVTKLPKPLHSFEHRYFYHWGYNAVRLSPEYRTKATTAIINRIEEAVYEAWVVESLAEDERQELIRVICNAINDRWVIHKTDMLTMLSCPDSGLNLGKRELNSAFATLIYEIHILADYVTTKDSLKPLGDFSFHVRTELVSRGLEVLFGHSQCAREFYEIKEKIDRVIDSSPNPSQEFAKVQSQTFQDFFSYIGPEEEQRRALAVLCLLRRHLPSMFSETYSQRLGLSFNLK